MTFRPTFGRAARGGEGGVTTELVMECVLRSGETHDRAEIETGLDRARQSRRDRAPGFRKRAGLRRHTDHAPSATEIDVASSHEVSDHNRRHPMIFGHAPARHNPFVRIVRLRLKTWAEVRGSATGG